MASNVYLQHYADGTGEKMEIDIKSLAVGVSLGMALAYASYLIGYFSKRLRRPTQRAVDGNLESVGTLLCDECQHPRNVADYILEKCPQCGDKEHVIQWLT